MSAHVPKTAAAIGESSDSWSFQEIYDQTFVSVTKLARYHGVMDGDLDDLAQEVFIAVHRRLNEFEGRASVMTWVSGILRRLVLNYRRGQRRKSAAEARSIRSRPVSKAR